MYVIVNQTDLSVGSLNQSYLIFAAEYYAESSFCKLAALPLYVSMLSLAPWEDENVLSGPDQSKRILF